jgi:8-oxo-dGTP diphosphatase
MPDDPVHIVAVVGYVRDAGGRVLLVRNARRGWEFPGGQVEEGEEIPAALVREVAEETCCRVGVDRLLGVYSNLSTPLVVHLFACAHLDGVPRACEQDNPEAGWYTETEARRLVTHPANAQRLGDALSTSAGVIYRAYRTDPYTLVRSDRA